ncbi:MAG: GNAT family protein [Pseudoxanthomonas sp.]|nr:GNAT family protein [Pseudoxanthomonas sp.]
MSAWTTLPTLTGRHARLVPLHAGHADALADAVADGELWRLPWTRVPAPDQVPDWIARALDEHGHGRALPFCVLDGEGRVVGSTRLGHLDPDNRRAEIGWTWYAARVQRTALNTQAKRLLLAHAFGPMACVAVELRTHRLNHRSRRAIERIGARLDGILRNHMAMPDGTLRDTAVYSILDSEWPAVRGHLDFLLERHA